MGTTATVVKDVGLTLFGLAGITWQTLTGDVNYALLGVFTAMVGLPGLTNMIPLVRGSGTASPSSQSATPGSSTDSGNWSTRDST